MPASGHGMLFVAAVVTVTTTRILVYLFFQRVFYTRRNHKEPPTPFRLCGYFRLLVRQNLRGDKPHKAPIKGVPLPRYIISEPGIGQPGSL